MSIYYCVKNVCRFLILILLLSFYTPAIGQAPIEWVQSVGDTTNQGFNDIMSTSDGGVILTGYDNVDRHSDVLLCKLDEDGVVEWKKTFGGNQNDIGNSVVQTPDGGYVMAGYSNSNNGTLTQNLGRDDAWILKVNSTGALVWSHTYGGGGFDDITSISNTSDGGFIVAGTTNSPTNNIITEQAGKKDALILKLNSLGNVMWSRTYGGSNNDTACEIKQTPDGGYAFAGYTWSDDIDISSNAGFCDMWLVKLQPNGNLTWSKTFGGTGEEHTNSFDLTSDGGYLLTGSSAYLTQSGLSKTIHHVDYAVAKVNSAGNLVWSKLFGGSKIDQAYGGIEASTGEYIISGFSSSADGNVASNYGFKDFWVLSLNTSGVVNWSKNYGGTQNDFATAVTETLDGGLAFAGHTWSDDNDVTSQAGIDDGWVIKLQSTGLPPTLDLGADQTVCMGEAVSISSNTTNCQGCSFLWNDGNTNATRLLNITSSTNYTVTATNSLGQSVNDIISITVNPLPTVTSAINNPSCDDAAIGSIDLMPTSPNGPFNYLWNTGVTTQNLANVGSGNYTVTITDANQCTNNLAFTLNSPTSFSISSTTSEIECNGDNDGLINLQISGGTGPFDYFWNTGAITKDVSNLAPGSYSVTITDANQCEEIRSFSIIQPNAIQNSAISGDVDCHDDQNGSISLNVTGGNAPYTYLWSNGLTTSNLTNLDAGDYTVTITDNANCNKIDTYTINGPTALIGNINSSQIPCLSSANGSIDLTVTGGNAPYTYAWSNGESTQDIDDLLPGTYSVIITDSNNCTTTEQGTIQNTNELVISDITSGVSCSGNTDGSININVTGGNGNYTYQWSNGLTSEDLANLAPGTYDVVVVDVSNCEGNASFVIPEPEPLEIQHSLFAESCLNSSDASIDLSISGGSGDYTYQWSNQSTDSALTNISAGNYFVTVTDSNQCTVTRSFQIMTNSAPTTQSAVFNASCFGLIDGRIDLSVHPDTEQYTYKWSNGPTSEDLENLSAGNYTVTITYGNGCVMIKNYQITEPSEILISETINQISCNGANDGAIDLNVSGGGNGGYQYDWSNGNSNGTISGLLAGTYNVTITDSNNCSVSANYEITQPQGVSFNENILHPTSASSSDGAIQIFPSGGALPFNVNWSNGSNSFNTTNLAAGNYTVTLTDANNCVTIETFAVPVMGTVGINDIDLVTDFTLFPNPTNGSFNVTANFSSRVKGTIAVSNLLGQLIDRYSFDESTVEKEFDGMNFPSGVYMVTLFTENGHLTEKLVIE